MQPGKGGEVTDNILLVIAGLAAASCFFGAAVYLLSVSNEIKVSKNEKITVVEYLDSIE
jgi:hypothetical protein